MDRKVLQKPIHNITFIEHYRFVSIPWEKMWVSVLYIYSVKPNNNNNTAKKKKNRPKAIVICQRSLLRNTNRTTSGKKTIFFFAFNTRKCGKNECVRMSHISPFGVFSIVITLEYVADSNIYMRLLIYIIRIHESYIYILAVFYSICYISKMTNTNTHLHAIHLIVHVLKPCVYESIKTVETICCRSACVWVKWKNNNETDVSGKLLCVV